MSLTEKDIISNSFVSHTRNTLKSGEILTYYIDNSYGTNSLDRYSLIQDNIIFQDTITTFSIGHVLEEKNFIRNIFNKLDDLIDLDFVEMSHNNGSMIDIYHINYSSIFIDEAIGQALPQRSLQGSWWDIFWKNSELKGNLNINSDSHTIIHEIGHSIGLSHPFNNGFDKRFTTDHTVMSYNRGIEGWETWFTKTDLNALISIWGRENDLGTIQYAQNSKNYKFKKDLNESYFIKTEIGYEEITSITALNFNDKSFNLEEDVIGVFNLIKGKDHISGMIYRLYNAAFSRFPDKGGLEYWIEKNQSKENSYRETASSFILSKEFRETYGLDTSNKVYIENLYQNVLERIPDIDGFNYWNNQLEQRYENRSELLMGFSESLENKLIFSNETSFY